MGWGVSTVWNGRKRRSNRNCVKENYYRSLWRQNASFVAGGLVASARELAAKPREKWGTQAMNYAGKQNAKNPTILPSSSLLRSRSGRSHAGAGSLCDTGPERLRARLTLFLYLLLLFKRPGTYYQIPEVFTSKLRGRVWGQTDSSSKQ